MPSGPLVNFQALGYQLTTDTNALVAALSGVNNLASEEINGQLANLQTDLENIISGAKELPLFLSYCDCQMLAQAIQLIQQDITAILDNVESNLRYLDGVISDYVNAYTIPLAMNIDVADLESILVTLAPECQALSDISTELSILNVVRNYYLESGERFDGVPLPTVNPAGCQTFSDCSCTTILSSSSSSTASPSTSSSLPCVTSSACSTSSTGSGSSVGASSSCSTITGSTGLSRTPSTSSSQLTRQESSQSSTQSSTQPASESSSQPSSQPSSQSVLQSIEQPIESKFTSCLFSTLQFIDSPCHYPKHFYCD